MEAFFQMFKEWNERNLNQFTIIRHSARKTKFWRIWSKKEECNLKKNVTAKPLYA